MHSSKWFKAFMVLGGLLQWLGLSQMAHASDHLCVSRIDGKVHCADGSSIYSANPSWTPRSTLNNMNVQRLWMIDRNSMQGSGTYGRTVAEPSRFLWASLTGTVQARPISAAADLSVATAPAADGSKAYFCMAQEGPMAIAGSHVIRCMDDADNVGATTVDLPKPGGKKVTRFAIKPPAIWALTQDGGVWYKPSITSSANDWVQQVGWASEIAVDPVNGKLCVIGGGQSIHCATNPTAPNPGWVQLPGWATGLTLYNGKLWVIGGGNSLWYKPDQTAVYNWIQIPGSGTSIVAGGDLSLPLLCRANYY